MSVLTIAVLTSFVDVEESVVAKVLSALTSLCELGLFQKMRIWELMSSTLGFIYHPNIWIRQGGREVFDYMCQVTNISQGPLLS